MNTALRELGRAVKGGCWTGYKQTAVTHHLMFGSRGYRSSKRSVRFVRRV